jgi:hypothetical protein
LSLGSGGRFDRAPLVSPWEDLWCFIGGPFLALRGLEVWMDPVRPSLCPPLYLHAESRGKTDRRRQKKANVAPGKIFVGIWTSKMESAGLRGLLRTGKSFALLRGGGVAKRRTWNGSTRTATANRHNTQSAALLGRRPGFGSLPCLCGHGFLLGLSHLFGVSDKGYEARIAMQRSEICVVLYF